jgi:hypothetical protein
LWRRGVPLLLLGCWAVGLLGCPSAVPGGGFASVLVWGWCAQVLEGVAPL